MTSFFTEIRQMLVPDREGKHGPLPPLLDGQRGVPGGQRHRRRPGRAAQGRGRARRAGRQAIPGGYRYVLIVLTLTITGIVADSSLVKGGCAKAARRLISVAMLVGALAGALLVLHAHIVYPLVIALAAVAVIALATRVLARSDPAWTRG
jgi:hypothetical protein